MTRLLPISGRKMSKILERLGFAKVHQVGSHARYVHPDGRKTVVYRIQAEKYIEYKENIFWL